METAELSAAVKMLEKFQRIVEWQWQVLWNKCVQTEGTYYEGD
jgi:hypothetical protein